MIPVNELPPIPPEEDQKLLETIADSGLVNQLVNRHTNPQRFKEDPDYRNQIPNVTTYMGDCSNLWIPATITPWSLGKNFPKDYKWDPSHSPFPSAARTAFLIGELTEENLPWYTYVIQSRVRGQDALEFWNQVWTGEEDRHADVMRNFMILGRVVDPIELEHGRMRQLVSASVPTPASSVEMAVYVTMQELATRISHQNTGRLISDTAKADSELYPLLADGTELAEIDDSIIKKFSEQERIIYTRQIGRAIMTRVAGDENKHFAFYSDFVEKGAIPANPSLVVKAAEKQIRDFQMPGTGIQEYRKKALEIAYAGIYDPVIHVEQILKFVLKRWNFENLTELDPEAEQSRERTLAHIDRLEKQAKRFEEKRDADRVKILQDGNIDEIWVGKPDLE